MPHPTCSWQTRTIPPAQPGGRSASVLTSPPQILSFRRNHAFTLSFSPGKTRSKESSHSRITEACSGITGRAHHARVYSYSESDTRECSALGCQRERHHTAHREYHGTAKQFHSPHHLHFRAVDHQGHRHR